MHDFAAGRVSAEEVRGGGLLDSPTVQSNDAMQGPVTFEQSNRNGSTINRNRADAVCP
jgi:hypothetical protein